MFHKVERRLRDARVVEVLDNVELRMDHKADFQEEANLKPVFEELKELGLNPEMRRTKSIRLTPWCIKTRRKPSERRRGLLSQPEYRRFRALARTIARHNEPPFVVVKGERPRIAVRLERSARAT